MANAEKVFFFFFFFVPFLSCTIRKSFAVLSSTANRNPKFCQVGIRMCYKLPFTQMRNFNYFVNTCDYRVVCRLDCKLGAFTKNFWPVQCKPFVGLVLVVKRDFCGHIKLHLLSSGYSVCVCVGVNGRDGHRRIQNAQIQPI